MKKTFIIIYSVCISLVLIFAISFFAVNIYNESAHGSLRTEIRFEKMCNAIFNASTKKNISADELSRQIRNAVGDTKDFSYLMISTKDNAIYVFPSELTEVPQKDSSKLILDYKRANSGPNGVTIQAGMYTLRPDTVFYYAEISFFIILISTLITIIVIIVYNRKELKNKKHIQRPVKYVAQKEETEEEEEEEEEEPEPEPEPENKVFEAAPVKQPEPSYAETPVKEELPVKEYEPMELEEIPGSEETGLFSPDTGLGWESYLLTRLDNELNRATASELDLALFVIKMPNVDRKAPVMKEVCDYLITEFQFKDLIFEYKNDSVCALKISMNIDAAIDFAEKLVEQIKSILNDPEASVLIGITTRGIRMVTGERLLKEADEAVVHAAEDKNCPVVGFRADAIKYRKFIESN